MACKISLEKIFSNITDFMAIILMQRIGDIIACEPVIGYAKAMTGSPE